MEINVCSLSYNYNRHIFSSQFMRAQKNPFVFNNVDIHIIQFFIVDNPLDPILLNVQPPMSSFFNATFWWRLSYVLHHQHHCWGQVRRYNGCWLLFIPSHNSGQELMVSLSVNTFLGSPTTESIFNWGWDGSNLSNFTGGPNSTAANGEQVDIIFCVGAVSRDFYNNILDQKQDIKIYYIPMRQ